jgi:hypothetical protein
MFEVPEQPETSQLHLIYLGNLSASQPLSLSARRQDAHRFVEVVGGWLKEASHLHYTNDYLYENVGMLLMGCGGQFSNGDV